jgi:hypothetical protein
VGEETNATIKTKMVKGRRYIIRVRIHRKGVAPLFH